MRKLAILQKLVGTSWGANLNILKHVYQGRVLPHFEYGLTAWCKAEKTLQHSLEKIPDQALQMITGFMQSTPIKTMI